MKKLLSLSFIVVLLAGCTAPVTPRENQGAHNPTVTVAASFYPLAFLAKQIGGDVVSVLQVTPGGIEPHDYEPSSQQRVAIHNADVLLINGAGVDNWGDKIIDELDRNGIITIRMIDKITTIDGIEDKEEEGHEDEHEHGEYDPHIWLDPVLVKREATLIRDALMQADPTNAAFFRANTDALEQKLSTLDNEYRSGLADCEQTFIVTSHNAFHYMAKRYGFQSLPIAGFGPGQEPSPKRIAELADLAREKNIKYIFFETLVSPKLAQTLANEIGAESLVLNPIEGLTTDDEAQRKDYISIMRENLANLRTAMQCQ